MAPSTTLAPVRASFRAVVRAVAPLAAALDEDAWRRGEAAVDAALADRPPGVRRRIVLFLRLAGLLARLRHGRALERLAPEEARSLLAGLERAPVLLLRRGFWGVRTLAYLAVYTQPDVRAALGYRATALGWECRGGSQGPWPERNRGGASERGIMGADWDDHRA
jgi:hypothetical protein